MDSIEEDCFKNWNSLTESEKIALVAYSFQIRSGMPSKGLQDFVNTLQDRASVFDVPAIFLN